MTNIIIRMEGIHKSFGGIKALSEVDFDLREGEVHALLGENGAGKSTLMKCLAGICPTDRGHIWFKGVQVKISQVTDSLALGIAFIQQELVLADQLTVADNVFMGREPLSRLGLINRKQLFREAQRLIDELEGGFNVHLLAGSLSTAQKQIVEIAKAMSIRAQVVIMDEPTAALSKREVDRLFTLIERLKRQKISIVYISHRMEEIFMVSDRITVLRDGRKIGTCPSNEVDEDALIRMMVGHSLADYFGARKSCIGQTILTAEGLTRFDGRAVECSFTLHKGEIVGFAGLVGAGRTELMQMLFGVVAKSSGVICLDGRTIHVHHPWDALKHGIALVPEDRKLQGLVLDNSVRFNLTLSVLERFIHLAHVDRAMESRIAGEYIDRLDIKVSSPEQQAVNLSGGNQQKVVLAKWLAVHLRILILDEPTRGVDVGAKAEIYALMGELIRSGISIIMVSSELPELLGMSDRIYVMHEGRIKACLERAEANQESILRYALGVKTNE
ncbi:MAG: sugar ABC transporter ATP-binding protein [Clostridia bacterium]